MSDVMLTLGPYRFGLDTAAPSEIQRSTEYRWAAIERVGQLDALQSTGPGADTITLPGVVYPHWRGGLGQLDAMRSAAAERRPLLLTTGYGAVMGLWVIERIDETQSVWLPGGVPRKQTFSIQLRRYA